MKADTIILISALVIALSTEMGRELAIAMLNPTIEYVVVNDACFGC